MCRPVIVMNLAPHRRLIKGQKSIYCHVLFEKKYFQSVRGRLRLEGGGSRATTRLN